MEQDVQQEAPAIEQAPAQEAPAQEAPSQEQPKIQVFDNPQDLAASMQSEPAPAANTPDPDPAPVQEDVQGGMQEVPVQAQVENPVQDQVSVQPEPEQVQYRQEDVEGAVLGFLSERLGREVSSFDDLSAPQKLDERLEVISKFVQETGRRPEDWFAYQQLNPSEMDDFTALRVQMASEHPNLSRDEINLLLKSKYMLDPDVNDAQAIQLSQLQLKMDGQKAKESIEALRADYMSPVEQAVQQPEEAPLIDESWVAEMAQNVDALTGLEFDLGGDKTFTFGIDDGYKTQLKHKNANLENYFDPYVNDDGSWDYDLLSSHRAVIDNIDTIVQSAYRQGMSDGQRGVVQNAANVQSVAPDDASGQSQNNPLQDQLRQIMRSQSSRMTFNI
tara:strand:- start:1445 stop:2608 length:1164 start_codon:yes stop_codon:yes gene_type:complete